MSRSFYNKKLYIETLSDVISARHDVRELTFHKANNGNEYVFMHLVTGDVMFFNITDYSYAAIFHIFAELECGGKPTEWVTDPKERLEIGMIFN